ncbi:hypothetical protein ISF_06560 [Cordyceps fumosorosea ARSEF 2679]|uniref:Uncharacterized protein n=1 Tax=Cordyceps fumosorosea (strain ARSEF 2679) TaxID=1081104 RepID=A0A167RNU4_CORFA|nr:hypothetical protein ISF_06560 [Cordyceps fumosorosea ARSEF 2679]OAA58777.1 hypothetical protein ISF_06560 [Cordyceps fumosorosea ARSEF 2679]
MSPVLDTIDHVYLRASNASIIYNELVNNAGLPIAWPFRSVADDLSSGAVSLGNLILELVQTNNTCAAMPFVPEYGVALTPHAATMAESRERAATRGIEMGADDSFYDPSGNLLWTRASLPQLSGAGLDTFFCDYTADQWPLRDGSRAQLATSRGGALGITGVEAMTVRSAHLRQTTEKWTLITTDREDKDMPTVHVVAGEDEGLHALTIRVRDVEAAERKFKELLPHFPDSLLQWQFI